MIDEKEVDFIATNKRYIQVTEIYERAVHSPRELAPLRKIRDKYEKMIIVNECANPVTQDRLKVIKLTDFLLDEDK